MKKAWLISFLFIMSFLAAVYNACTVPKDLMPVRGTEITNPMNPASGKVLVAICSMVNRCHSQATLESCLPAVSNLAGAGQALGYMNPSSNLATISQAELSGSIADNSGATTNCITLINSLNCIDSAVANSYNPSASNPYAEALNLISLQPGSCNDLYSGLQITPQIDHVDINNKQLFLATGGLPPYSFSMIAGSGSITSGGAFVASGSADMQTVRVKDALGRTSDLTFAVINPAFTWEGKTDSTWNNSNNWHGGVVPGPGDVAVFDDTCQTCTAVIEEATTVGGIYMASNFTGSIKQSPGAANTLTVENFFDQNGGSFLGGDSIITQNGSWAFNGGSFTSTSGTMIFNGAINVSGNPNFSANGGTVQINGDLATIVPGNIAFNNVTFSDQYSNGQIIMGTMTVLGTLVLNEPNSNIRGGIINLSGNLVATNTHVGNGYDVLIRFVGPGIQEWNGAAFIPEVEIATPGSVVVSRTVLCRDFKYTTGTFSSAGSTVQFTTNGTNALISPQNVAFDNVAFVSTVTDREIIDGTLNVLGNLDISQTEGSLDQGFLAISGNLLLNGNAGGTAGIIFNGNNNQTYSTTSGTLPSGPMTVNKTVGTLTLMSDLIANSAGQNFLINGGAVGLNGFKLSVGDELALQADTVLNCNGGCGTGTSCGLGAGHLMCASLVNSGTINP